MAHVAQTGFVFSVSQVHPEFFRGVRVLEIGSRNVNGSVREFFTDCEYVGLDCTPGEGVDVICLAHEYDGGPFDTVISCEAFEHDPHFFETVGNALRLLRPRGLFVATWASPARPEHGTTATGAVYGPDGGYYQPPSRGHFIEAAGGRLEPLSIVDGCGGQDLYAVGWRTY